MSCERILFGLFGLVVGAIVGLVDVVAGGVALAGLKSVLVAVHGVVGLVFGWGVHGMVESNRRRLKSYSTSLDALANAVAAKDDETNGHCKRVVQYSLLIGREAGLPKKWLQQLEWGALVHDIGKIAVPDHILKKPGALADEEWLVMKEHAYMGWLMIKDVDFLKEGLDVVLHHHERWDGRGYPHQLQGEGIPLLARIFAIADTFDAITSDRPYRKAQSIEFARQEILHHAGTQFCDRCVAAFLRIPEAELERVQEEAKILEYDALQLRKLKQIS
jgi:HD-GYP domain-containing protein (c-di-GMP phosphodiesterase class II)